MSTEAETNRREAMQTGEDSLATLNKVRLVSGSGLGAPCVAEDPNSKIQTS
jgi:hypothetical protein